MKGPSGKGYAEMAVSRCDTDENESFLNDNEQTDNVSLLEKIAIKLRISIFEKISLASEQNF